jgi:hypothetical protein
MTDAVVSGMYFVVILISMTSSWPQTVLRRLDDCILRTTWLGRLGGRARICQDSTPDIF